MDECKIQVAHEGKVFEATVLERWRGNKNIVFFALAKEPTNYWLIQDFFLEDGRKFDRVVSLQSAEKIDKHRDLLKSLGYIKEDKCEV
jgi:hypothetical protein